MHMGNIQGIPKVLFVFPKRSVAAKYMQAGVMIDGRWEPTRQGVPQGGPLSPILANILLDELDKELERRGHQFVRYADDFIIMVKSQRAGERVFASIRKYLERELKLEVNEAKSKVARLNECTFLGFQIIREKRGQPENFRI